MGLQYCWGVVLGQTTIWSLVEEISGNLKSLNPKAANHPLGILCRDDFEKPPQIRAR